MPKTIGRIKIFELSELEGPLEVTNATLRTYIRDGKLPGRKVGNKWFVSEAGLEQFFINSNQDRVFREEN